MKTRTLHHKSIFSIIILLVLGGCTYYKTLQVNEHSKEAISTLSDYKSLVLVHNESVLEQYKLEQIRITEDSIFGFLLRFGKVHDNHAKSVRKKDTEKIHIDPLLVMHIYLQPQDLQFGEFRASLEDIQSIEIHETATGKSTMVSASAFIGITAGVFATVGGIVILTSDCVCPFVESYNHDSSEFHGSLFPGAIFKSLEREDYLELKNIVRDKNGDLNIRVFNNMPEIEYLDQLKLYEVSSGLHENVVTTGSEQFTSYTNTQKPIYAISGDKDTINEIVEADMDSYLFNNVDQTNELNSLDVIFEKRNMSDHPKLTLVAQQSRWLEKVANFFFYSLGNRYEEWVEAMNQSPPEKWIESKRDYGIALNVYLKSNGEWNRVGSFSNVGSLGLRNLILDLDLSNHNDSLIELRFESAYKIWEIDQIAISDDFNEDVSGNPIELSTATNHLGEDVKGMLDKVDGEYLIQNGKGTYVELHIPGGSDHNSHLFLRGTGYYHHVVDIESKPNYTLLKTMKHDLAFHELSKALEFSYAVHNAKNNGTQ